MCAAPPIVQRSVDGLAQHGVAGALARAPGRRRRPAPDEDQQIAWPAWARPSSFASGRVRSAALEGGDARTRAPAPARDGRRAAARGRARGSSPARAIVRLGGRVGVGDQPVAGHRDGGDATGDVDGAAEAGAVALQQPRRAGTCAPAPAPSSAASSRSAASSVGVPPRPARPASACSARAAAAGRPRRGAVGVQRGHQQRRERAAGRAPARRRAVRAPPTGRAPRPWPARGQRRRTAHGAPALRCSGRPARSDGQHHRVAARRRRPARRG